MTVQGIYIREERALIQPMHDQLLPLSPPSPLAFPGFPADNSEYPAYYRNSTRLSFLISIRRLEPSLTTLSLSSLVVRIGVSPPLLARELAVSYIIVILRMRMDLDDLGIPSLLRRNVRQRRYVPPRYLCDCQD